MSLDDPDIQFFIPVPNPGNSTIAPGDVVLRGQEDLVNEQPLPGGGNPSVDPDNTVFGFEAGATLTTGKCNSLFGVNAGNQITTQTNNTLIGHDSGKFLRGGMGNSFLGKETGGNAVTGSRNIVLGSTAGSAFIGVESRNIIVYGTGQANDSATIRIGEQGTHETKTFISGIHSTSQSGASILNVTVDENGHMGTDAGGGGLTGKTTVDNTCVGDGAGDSLTTGVDNTLIGVNAGNAITSGSDITVMGDNAYPLGNTSSNLFIGSNAGGLTTTGSNMCAVGTNALSNYTAASIGSCTAFGTNALLNCNAPSNTGLGLQAFAALTSATGGVAVGGLCMRNVTTGTQNTAVGFDGIHDCTTGARNVGIGYECGFSMDTGNDNVFLGRLTGSNNVSGSDNVYIGNSAGANHTTSESGNFIVKAPGAATDTDMTRINQGAAGCFIGGIASVIPAGTPQAVIINPATGELGQGQVIMNGAGAMSGIESMEMTNTATEDDTVVQLIDVDAAGFAPTTAIGIALETGAIDTGDVLTASLNVIDQDASLGGRVFGNTVLTTSSGVATVHSIGSGVNVNPIYHQSGTHVDADSLDNDGADVTVALSSGGGGAITIFLANSDTFTTGDAVKFSEIEFILSTDSTNGGIAPTFEFSTGVGTFDFFSPQDGTNGMRNSGSLSWDNADLVGWAVDGNTEFTIKITRTRVTISTPPVAELVQIASVNTFEWDEFGDVNIRSLTASTNVAGVDSIKLEGTGAASGWNCDFTGLINIDTSNANTQALTLAASATAGGIEFTAGSGGINGTTTGGYDFHSSINMAGEGIKLRATGTAGTITLDAGTGGVVIAESDINGIVFDDSTSLFNATMKASALMTASYNIVLPIAQAATDGQALVNNGSGTTRWDNPVAAFPTGHINNLGMTNGTTTDTDKDILAGQCRDFDDTFNIISSSTLTVDNTTTGANGLDTGSLAANTWYAIHIIADTSLSSVPAGLMSLSETAPTLPGTYDVFRRVGWARTDGTSDFYKAFYGKSGQSRIAYWDESETVLEVLTDGSATVYTVVDCSEWVPPVPGFAYFNTNHFASDEQDFLTICPTNLVPDLDGLSPVSNPRANRTFGGASSGDATGSTFQFMTISDSAGEILYGNSSGTEDSDIWVIAYIDSLTI